MTAPTAAELSAAGVTAQTDPVGVDWAAVAAAVNAAWEADPSRLPPVAVTTLTLIDGLARAAVAGGAEFPAALAEAKAVAGRLVVAIRDSTDPAAPTLLSRLQGEAGIELHNPGVRAEIAAQLPADAATILSLCQPPATTAADCKAAYRGSVLSGRLGDAIGAARAAYDAAGTPEAAFAVVTGLEAVGGE